MFRDARVEITFCNGFFADDNDDHGGKGSALDCWERWLDVGVHGTGSNWTFASLTERERLVDQFLLISS